jgi:hypothetical protein
MNQDDFTILLSEGTDILTCDLNVYLGLHHLWRMVERYKMTTPVAFRVIDNQARCVRSFRGILTTEGNWQLEEMDLPESAVQASALEFPLNINSQDASGHLNLFERSIIFCAC